ncbi:GNAT family N-acetyltransferase [Caldilinea sp.]|uniref:GNAT family N-acetyltransferase n=1 Tax=Caldilinea sp. TaxID=2293560 RepID=UPI002C07A782|nr:GNAT family N-acetyltransferase [Anaerolineales bacterium]HQY93535.1 GNAT family N-acetyltransferase [Caldilinea sp.]HRA67621.1 GNAT family N-acetyltransferase [Caldilinea sp.]
MKPQNHQVEIWPLQAEQWEIHKRIRLAALADAPYAFTTRLADVVTRPDQQWMEITARRAGESDGVTYFAAVAGEPCAMAACILTELGAEMLAVWVAPAHRKLGVGQALVDYAHTWAIQREATTLIVGVYADNQDAVTFYTRAGFRLTDAERLDAQAKRRQILLMTMPLDAK